MGGEAGDGPEVAGCEPCSLFPIAQLYFPAPTEGSRHCLLLQFGVPTPTSGFRGHCKRVVLRLTYTQNTIHIKINLGKVGGRAN